MSRIIFALALSLLGPVGCADRDSGVPAKLTPQQQDAIGIARKAVAQFEDWGDRAEYKIERRGALWRVTAWLVVHPEAKGNQRYVPWGCRTVVVDDAGKVVEYVTGR